MFDFRFSFKQSGKVLRYLISLKHDGDNGIDIPEHILSTLPDVTEGEFTQYIFYLADCGYIEYDVCDMPQKDNFRYISIRPHALAYFAEEERACKQRWKDWILGFVTGAVLASIPSLIDLAIK